MDDTYRQLPIPLVRTAVWRPVRHVPVSFVYLFLMPPGIMGQPSLGGGDGIHVPAPEYRQQRPMEKFGHRHGRQE